ncbi:beta-carotene hydroxylase 2, chloroplastic-like isoform X2 [Camellia sinensis]|uniref:beta-carotene hydroxylase 2, chloroplastic-like isoform X2 n=1 Tax=Camellia sinensis TaxID=4442 RepID=UPI001035DD59|nr:beta-carotene hydroxylase 2, chloroplastic-like isoform X2 [Camellia sinensis]
MAARFSVCPSSRSFRLGRNPFLCPKPNSVITPTYLFSLPIRRFDTMLRSGRKTTTTVCFVVEDKKLNTQVETNEEEGEHEEIEKQISAARLAEKLARKSSERFTYLVAAVMSSFGITSMAVFAVYYRFSWQMEGGEVPFSEMFGTFALSVGAAVGMEFWARWAHRALWHASLWHMHESHHKPREGPFELNDVFAIINAVPAIALLSYGFFHKGLVPGSWNYSVWDGLYVRSRRSRSQKIPGGPHCQRTLPPKSRRGSPAPPFRQVQRSPIWTVLGTQGT